MIKLMLKTVFIIAIGLTFISCSKSKTPFCSCMEAGDKLNDAMKDVYNKDVSASEKKNIENLKIEQEKLCFEFQIMDGAKMLELQKECENL